MAKRSEMMVEWLAGWFLMEANRTGYWAHRRRYEPDRIQLDGDFPLDELAEFLLKKLKEAK